MSDKELEELRAGDGAEGDDPIDAALAGLRDEAGPGPSFTARVMQEIDRRERGWLARARDAVLRPRVLRFNVVMALPLGVAATLLVALLVRGGEPGAPAATGPAQAAEAAPPRAVLVSFRLPAPGAERVAVAGDFNDWDVHRAPLRDDDGDGIWTGTVAVEPGRYAYMFVVDGETWVVDPAAAATQPDGFGGHNAVLRL